MKQFAKNLKMIENISQTFSTPTAQITTAISNLSSTAAAAIETLIAASSLSAEVATTIVPTALNDALAAITAEILSLESN